MRIYKYTVYICSDKFEHPMSADAKILSVQYRGGEHVPPAETEVFMQAFHDMNKPKITRRFIVYSTGLDFDMTGHKFIDTFQEGYFVGHLFELTEN